MKSASERGEYKRQGGGGDGGVGNGGGGYAMAAMVADAYLVLLLMQSCPMEEYSAD